MRVSSLINKLLKECGVSSSAAQAMENIAEQLLGNNDNEVYIEVNGDTDKDVDNIAIDVHGSLIFKIDFDCECEPAECECGSGVMD